MYIISNQHKYKVAKTKVHKKILDFGAMIKATFEGGAWDIYGCFHVTFIHLQLDRYGMFLS